MAHAATMYRDAGAVVRDIELPACFEKLHEAQVTIMRAEGGRTYLAEARRHGEALHPNLLALARELDTLDVDRLRRAYDLAASCRAAFDDLAGEYDAVLAPSATGEAPHRTLGTGDYVFNGMWTLLHTPCLNLPLYKTEAGLPVGVTLTGRRFSDRRVVRAAL
jgi:Asp-tRNA(Asn)/Glu-tRNA(Gln) amidotransferase A subunit family amidase